MATYLPITGLSRSQSVRIGGQQIKPGATYYVDISDGKTRNELERHSAIGAYIVVGPVSQDSGDVVVDWGAQTTQGSSGADLIVTTEDGELRNRSTGDLVDVNQTDITLSAANGSNPRIDLIQIHTGTGVVTKKDGTAAATPAAPAPDTNNVAVANVTVPTSATAVTNANITDRRPRG